ncbi:MAG: hypothetical protein AAFV29_20995, partial [Myxococcota bacterium]
ERFLAARFGCPALPEGFATVRIDRNRTTAAIDRPVEQCRASAITPLLLERNPTDALAAACGGPAIGLLDPFDVPPPAEAPVAPERIQCLSSNYARVYIDEGDDCDALGGVRSLALLGCPSVGDACWDQRLFFRPQWWPCVDS